MRILVVEDNHVPTTLLAEHLSARGHEAIAAYDGQLALVFCRQRGFDAVVINLLLADMYCVDVLEALHAEHCMPRAIVTSGHPELLEELSPRLSAVGVDTVIQQPFSFSEIDEALAQMH
jgi:DNA-binding response OmpR family regulator